MVNSKCFGKEAKNRATFEELQKELERICGMFDI
jgi:hypothetical protein